MNKSTSKELKDFSIQSFQTDLLSWYYSEKRDLPWRKSRDPYKIWVSETMLQQTRVDTVIPYYQNFMEKYPSMEKLAEADEQELLKIWEGLGYYSRARNLLSAVREVAESYGGVVPREKDEFLKLKGVGPYTAGAVLSIAYGIPLPAIDGNVMRVFSRVFYITEDITKTKTRKLFEEIGEQVISHKDPGGFNQALMELGAMVCTPGEPSCLLCPVREYCLAFEKGVQSELPVKSKRTKIKAVNLTAAVLTNSEGKILIRQRPEPGLLASLWEFPNIETANTKMKNLVADFEEKVGDLYHLNIKLNHPLGQIEHVFSHLKWNIYSFAGKADGSLVETGRLKFVTWEELNEYPLPVPHQKILQRYQALLGSEK